MRVTLLFLLLPLLVSAQLQLLRGSRRAATTNPGVMFSGPMNDRRNQEETRQLQNTNSVEIRTGEGSGPVRVGRGRGADLDSGTGNTVYGYASGESSVVVESSCEPYPACLDQTRANTDANANVAVEPDPYDDPSYEAEEFFIPEGGFVAAAYGPVEASSFYNGNPSGSSNAAPPDKSEFYN